ncbi:hypothetical protein [Arthrobacter sp. STN4]|nr:hypothetical protein [Arthrobacter sp. STN4]
MAWWDRQDTKDWLVSALVTEALAPLAAVVPEALRGKQLVTTPC